MKKINIINGNKVLEFGIRDIKFLLTKDIETLYETIQCIKCALSKEESEYRQEHQHKKEICIDDNKISLKAMKVWQISPTYSVIDDQKLQTNSLLQEYLISKIDSSTFQDTKQTINVLIQSFIDELNDDNLQIECININAKQLLKFMQVYAQQEDIRKDEFDFTYEELLLFQISLIEKINMQHIEFPIVFVIAPILTNKIVEKLRNCKDCYVIVITNTYLSSMKIEEIYLIEQVLMDFACMEEVYMMLEEQYHKRYTMEELNYMIKIYLQTEYTPKQRSFINSLNKLSHQ